MIFSEAGKALWDALDDYSQWDFTEYRIIRKASQTHYWIGNGPLSFDGVSPTPAHLGLIERHFLYRKARRMIGRMMADMLRGKV